jgi:type II secretory pathway component PulF
MSIPSASSVRRISLDEFIALADEMAALVRAGVPLERGLVDAAPGFTKRSSQLVAKIAERMQAGETLSQIIATRPEALPPAYAAVLEAGIRSGRISSALEGLASSARRAADLRRMTAASLVYPLLVVLVAYGLFLFSVLRLQPTVANAYRRLNVPTTELNTVLSNLGATANYWGPVLPIAIVALLAIWWRRSGRAMRANGRGVLAFLPTNRLMRYGRLAAFADTLALLIEHDAPLASSAAETGLPPVLAWLLSGDMAQANLVEALRRSADSYRARASRLEEQMRLYLPLGLILVLGCTSIVIYALTVFLPWYHLLYEIPSHT